MFRMKVERQMNLPDRTLLLGVPDYDLIPKTVNAGNHSFQVIGQSFGVKPPFVSLEIEKTDLDLKGKKISD